MIKKFLEIIVKITISLAILIFIFLLIPKLVSAQETEEMRFENFFTITFLSLIGLFVYKIYLLIKALEERSIDLKKSISIFIAILILILLNNVYIILYSVESKYLISLGMLINPILIISVIMFFVDAFLSILMHIK